MDICRSPAYWYWSMSTPHPQETCTDQIFDKEEGLQLLEKGILKKNMFSLRLHEMSTFQLLLRQALQNNSYLSSPPTSYSSWRTSDFKVSVLDAATREKDWMVSRGCIDL